MYEPKHFGMNVQLSDYSGASVAKPPGLNSFLDQSFELTPFHKYQPPTRASVKLFELGVRTPGVYFGAYI